MSAESFETAESFPPPVEEAGGYSGSKRTLLKLVIQIIHLVLAAAILIIGFAEFGVEPTVFDLFGKEGASVPDKVFKNTSYGIRTKDKGLEHILDAPILVLFVIYFLSVVWLKCRGVFAWLLTVSQISSMLMYLGVNAGLAHVLNWRYFSTRSVTILLDVLIFSFSWTVIVVTLLHIRGWFPFKVKKYRDIPYNNRSPFQKGVVIVWNFIALYVVLGLCLLIWFSKLYMSWACVHHKTEILLLCQFTNMVQCWPCSESITDCNVGNITECIYEYYQHPSKDTDGPIRCISPLYTVKDFPSAFCVFNYNIGPFTFVTVFSYVGGIYFFMRTVLNALVKCLFNIFFITIHFVTKVLKKHRTLEEDKEPLSVNEAQEATADQRIVPPSSDPRVSLLGPPLPHYYSKTGHTKYI